MYICTYVYVRMCMYVCMNGHICMDGCSYAWMYIVCK